MRNEENIHHMVDQYLEGNLVGEDLDIIRNKIKKDPEFANEVALHKALRDEIMIQREAELRSLLTEKGEVAYIKSMWSGTWVRASAAIFIAFIGLYAFLKLYNPNQSENLAKTDSAPTKTEQQEQPPSADEAPVEEIAKVEPQDSIDLNTNTGLSIEELTEEKEELAIAEKENKDVEKLKTIREEADALEADEDVQVQKDQMVAQRTMLVYNVSEIQTVQANKTTTATRDSEEITLSEVQTKKRKGIFKKKEKETDKTVDAPEEDFESDDAVAGNATRYIQSAGEEIKLQYWKNILDFTGYSYSNSILKVYGLEPTKPAVLKKYLGNIYLLHDGKIYQIRKTNRALPFQNINDPNIVKALTSQ